MPARLANRSSSQLATWLTCGISKQHSGNAWAVASLTAGKNPNPTPVDLPEPGTNPPLMDSQNPAVKIIIKGRDIHGCIIDGGSGVNVISEATCHDLGITHWEPFPFWLRMANTCSIRPMGLIRHLNFMLGVHIFTILAVVIRLNALDACK